MKYIALRELDSFNYQSLYDAFIARNQKIVGKDTVYIGRRPPKDALISIAFKRDDELKHWVIVDGKVVNIVDKIRNDNPIMTLEMALTLRSDLDFFKEMVDKYSIFEYFFNFWTKEFHIYDTYLKDKDKNEYTFRNDRTDVHEIKSDDEVEKVWQQCEDLSKTSESWVARSPISRDIDKYFNTKFFTGKPKYLKRVTFIYLDATSTGYDHYWFTLDTTIN